MLLPGDFAGARGEITRIEAAAQGHDGHESLGEALLIDLDRPRRDSRGFLVPDAAYAHVCRSDNAAASVWTAGITAAPGARDAPTVRALLDGVVAHVGATGGGAVVLWTPGAPAYLDVVLRAAGFEATRELYEMRVVLPLAEEPRWPGGIRVRTFEPGCDDAEWLTVNNRAFAGHAEQGNWTEDTLRRRMAEPWFDPQLFLLAIDDAGLAGFDWLKMHPARDNDPVLGEIFVIGVDPRMQGSGLGLALALAGMRAVFARGAELGMLFCAADNAPALRLYKRLGFTVHRIDRAYERSVDPA